MPELLFEKHDDIAVVTFNRPERRNAITPEMIVGCVATFPLLSVSLCFSPDCAVEEEWQYQL